MGRISKEARWKLRLQDARSGIADAIGQAGPVQTTQSLDRMLSDYRSEWRLQKALTSEVFIDYLCTTRLLSRRKLLLKADAPASSYPRERVLFVTPDANEFDIALSLRTGSYLSHLSAAFVHRVTDLLPRTVTVNKMQSPKLTKVRDMPTQDAIDRAFAKPARRTSNVYAEGANEYVLLSSGFTADDDAIVEVEGPERGRYPATSLERTILDLVIRPHYSGGVVEVLSICKEARRALSVNKLVGLLRRSNYVYPYHQAVGFFLERAGYPEQRVRKFEAFGIDRKFYLENTIANPQFSQRWQLFYPAVLDA